MFSQKSTGVLIRAPFQVRYASKKAKKPVKNQTTSMRSNLARFLGPKNYKGFHKRNPFFFPATNNTPNYVSQYPIVYSGNDRKNIAWNQVFDRSASGKSFRPRVSSIMPFAANPHTKTNMVVSKEMKADIVREINENKKTAQEVSYTFGLSVPRVEAIVELENIRIKWEAENKITSDLKRMATVMEGMLPQVRYNKGYNGESQSTDDLSEIPVLEETRTQRFITLAESEPFGPLDAAKTLGIDSASAMLEKLKVSEDHHQRGGLGSKASSVYRAPQLENEKVLFRFIPAKVGEVGFRYGASRDDQKHNRKVQYNTIGQKKYAYQ